MVVNFKRKNQIESFKVKSFFEVLKYFGAAYPYVLYYRAKIEKQYEPDGLVKKPSLCKMHITKNYIPKMMY